jgi:hypothetical protein
MMLHLLVVATEETQASATAIY